MAEGGEDFNVPRDENVKAEQDLGLGELSLDVEKELERRPLMKDVGCGRDQPIRRAARQRPISRAEEAEPEKRPFLTTRKGMFGMEEYLRCAAPHGPKLRGFSFMPTKHLKGLSGEWPTDQPINSTNIYFLRGLGVTFFYQSQMSKARALLLKVSECESGEDLDIALMLAECACALPGEEWETLTDALERLCECVEGSCAFTAQFIDDWDKKLIKNGRFMGYIILQYVLYLKLKQEPLRVRNLERLTYTCFGKIVQRLSQMDIKIGGEKTALNAAIYSVLRMFQDEISGFKESRRQAYVRALCGYCVARFMMFDEPSEEGSEHIENSIKIMETEYGKGHRERMLYGDLIAARGFVLYHRRQYREATEIFSKALSIYEQEVKDHKSLPGSRDRVLKLMCNYIAKAAVLADTLQ